MSLPDCTTIHAALTHWARQQPHRIALDDGAVRLDFAALAQQVAVRAAALEQANAPAICWVDASATVAVQLISFLAILSANRSAAVSDPDWPPAMHAQIARRIPADPIHAPAPATANSAFYIGFTSGSSGLPKGFRRTHGSWIHSFAICRQTFGDSVCSTMLSPGRLSHSTFLFGALLGLWSGAGTRLQTRFAAAAALNTLARRDAQAITAVPSQLLMMLELAQRRRLPAMPGVRLVLIGGAAWNRARTPELQQLFPNARLIEFYGTSETSFIAWTDSASNLPDQVVGQPFANVELRIDAMDAIDSRDAAPAAALMPGLIYVRSPMVFSDYVLLAQAAAQPALLRDGDWLSVRDVGYLDEQGRLHLLGRQQRMLLTQGKNLFPEEVESVLAAHPAVAAASVQGSADAMRGMQVVALLQLHAPVSSAELRAWCQARLEAYKAPRRYYTCADWPLQASGKTHHQQLAQYLTTATHMLVRLG